MFFRKTTTGDTETYSDKIARLKKAIAEADAVVIGAGAGLSTSAGFIYSGERFEKHFSDFEEKYGFHDMYSGGFTPFRSKEELWAFWSRNIWVNRYMNPPKPVYDDLLSLVKDKDYFVITTNVDHCFQKAGFDKARLFYTQGDYGLFQCSQPCHDKTYDNEETVRNMILSQGWEIGDGNALTAPEGVKPRMTVDPELTPVCPVCGRPMKMLLRVDDTFVEDEGWRAASARYQEFLRTHGGKVLYLELGVGYNTPVIIKYPFWNRTEKNRDATYACISYGDADCPPQIQDRSICIDSDIGKVLQDLK